jgi:hypothetical protein
MSEVCDSIRTETFYNFLILFIIYNFDRVFKKMSEVCDSIKRENILQIFNSEGTFRLNKSDRPFCSLKTFIATLDIEKGIHAL